MIPKFIHFCWFGKQDKPRFVLECMESWKKFLPDFEIFEWNEDNFSLQHPFIENAVNKRLWAFVADYARVEILKKSGGIYLDTDMLFIKNLPEYF